jgi:DNA-directed RNA polymerase subunit RPC12/RpoP
MSEEIKFECSQCGKQFDPDPDSMVELHWESKQVQVDEVADGLTTEELRSMSTEDLREFGLTAELRERMLRGEEVTAGGMCICIECQDRLAEEAEPEG